MNKKSCCKCVHYKMCKFVKYTDKFTTEEYGFPALEYGDDYGCITNYHKLYDELLITLANNCTEFLELK
jgi:hypothetical protein